MKGLQILGVLIFLSNTFYGQIDMADSTAQVIGYWNIHDQQSYNVTLEKYRIKDSDTSSRELYKYEVDITIVDSTADSYVIDWHYKNYDIQSENKLIQKLFSVSEDMTVRIRTDELGVFQEVINWEDLRDYILKGTKLLKEEMKAIPNMQDLILQIEGMYSTKESIEAGAISEIQQFYTFHGLKYAYAEEYTSDIKNTNLYGGEPFDATITFWLDELNPDDNNFIIRMNQVINSEQLTNATYDYMVKMAETLKVPGPKREDIPEVTNEIYTASRIHGSGWIIYSVETKVTKVEGQTSIQENIIELQ